jgi:hypothetical protein
MSAFAQVTFPIITPLAPITIFPEVSTLPSSFPSILKSAFETTSPVI